MKESGRVMLWIAGLLVANAAVLIGVGFWSMSRAGYVFTNGRSLHENLSGRWDWSTRRQPCADSAHVIAFSDDGGVMTISQEQPAIDSVGVDWTVATYDIVEVGPSRIRGAIRGETRLTAEGEPVVWDLVVVGSNEYRWHRTDWSTWGFTPGVIRCTGAGAGMADVPGA